MARTYGKTDLKFWQEPKYRRLSDDGRLLFLYLSSAPTSTAAGAYTLPMSYMIDDLQWTEPRIVKALQELSLEPLALWDRDSRVVYLSEWWQTSTIENPNVAAHVCKLLLALPDCALKAKAIDDLKRAQKFPRKVHELVGDWTWNQQQPALPLSMPVLQLAPPQSEDEEEEQETPISKKGTRLAADWYPDADMLAYAEGKGMSHQDIDAEVTKFIRYFTGPDAKRPVMKSWLRAWQNWIDTATKGAPRRNGYTNGNGNGHTLGSSEVPWAARVADFRRNRLWLSSWGPEPGQPHCKVPAELLAPVSD